MAMTATPGTKTPETDRILAAASRVANPIAQGRSCKPPPQFGGQDWGRHDSHDGAGWAKLKDDKLHGMIFIHLGDESGFVAQNANVRKRLRRK